MRFFSFICMQFMEKVISLIQHFSQASDFETIMKPHLLGLYRLAFRLTGKAADAEDLVQDVLVKLYPKRQELAEVEKLRPWLAKVLYRTFLDEQRRLKRSPLHLVNKKTEHEDCDILDSLPSDDCGPEEDTQAYQMRGLLQQAIRSLNPDQQHICMLHDVEGYTLSELEDILETPIGTLKSRLHRARKNLRIFLQQETT